MHSSTHLLAFVFLFVFLLGCIPTVRLQELNDEDVENLKGLKNEKVALKTDDEVVEREEQAINPDGYSVSELKMMRELAEQHQFQAEVSELMNIIINSLYSNKDVFLRELISNASDALDKIRFMSLTDPEQLGQDSKLQINIKADQENKVLHISDSGIGMTKEELVNNLGRIAKSGTKEFVQKIHETGGDPNSLIGQFGVGFYSAFLVADRVVVTSKNNSDKQYVWESNAKDSFSVTEDPKGNTLGRGTRISLYLKEEQFGYLDQSKLENLIRKYSEFINFPIFLWASSTEEREVPVEDDEVEEEETDNEFEDVDETEEDKPKTKTVKETVWDWTRMNKNKPIWQRNSSEITDDEYNEFYKSLSKDYRDPLAYIHFSGEGEIEFKSILYIPAMAPDNMFDTSRSTQNNIKLYVRRVFITDEFSDLTPKWLSFVKGVVDSADLPLNVSREILQQNKALETIKKKLIRKAIAMFQKMADEAEENDESKAKWDQFYTNYSTNIKLGVIEDRINKHRLSKLLRFHSSKVDSMTSLDDYVSRMKEKQEQIYYIGGQDVETLQSSPLVERLLKRGYEVLYMIEPIDEYLAPGIGSYDGKYPLVNVGREGLKLDGEEEEEEKFSEEYQDLIDFLKEYHSSRLEKVLVSTRLTKSPSAIVSNSWGYTANMERIVRAQALGDSKMSNLSKSAKKIMEINPRHPIIKELKHLVELDSEDPVVRDTADLLYDTAALHSGFNLDEPSRFAERIHRMMKLSLKIPADAEADEVPDPVEPEPEPEIDEAEVDEEWNDEETNEL